MRDRLWTKAGGRRHMWPLFSGRLGRACWSLAMLFVLGTGTVAVEAAGLAPFPPGSPLRPSEDELASYGWGNSDQRSGECDRWLRRAWEANAAQDWSAAEQFFIEASALGPLRNGDFSGLSTVQRLQGKFEQSVLTSQLGFHLFPCLDNGLDLFYALYEAGEVDGARAVAQMVERQGDPRVNADLLEQLLFRVGYRQWRITITLDHNRLGPDGQARFNREGYYQCYFPSDVYNQKCIATVLQGAKHERGTDRVGNRYFRIWPAGDDPVRVQFDVAQVPSDIPKPSDWTAGDLPSEVSPFLRASFNIDPNTDTVAGIASSLRADSIYGTLLNIQAWGGQNLRPSGQLPPGLNGLPGSEIVLRSGIGACGPQAGAICALLRHCGIAARPVVGFSNIGKGLRPNWHTWVEVYAPTLGWLPMYADRVPGSLNTSLVRLAAESPLDDPIEAGDNTCGRIFGLMFQQDAETGHLNIELSLVRESLSEADPPQ